LEIQKAFGTILQRIRTEQKLTRERLAELARVDYTYVYLLETGKRQPSLTTVFLLAKALDCPPSKLISTLEAMRPTFSGREDREKPKVKAKRLK